MTKLHNLSEIKSTKTDFIKIAVKRVYMIFSWFNDLHYRW